MYRTRIFEACKNTHELKAQFILKASRVWVTQIWTQTDKALQYSCFASKYTHYDYQIAELLFQRLLSLFMEIAVGCSKAPFQFCLSQTWNLLLPPSRWRCKQFCQYDTRSFSCSKCWDRPSTITVIQGCIRSLITLSRKRRIQLFATLGNKLFGHDGRWTVCLPC